MRVVFCLTEVSQHYMMSNFVKAMVYAEEAYAINPENDKSEAVLIDVLTKNLNKISNIERITDTLESYAIKYPKLKLNTEFKSIMGQAYLIRSSMMYESGKVKLAEKYRGLFEATVIPGSAHNVNENRIVDFYTQACFQYFRSGQQSAAVKALQTGLKYVPNEPSMSRRLMGIR